MTAGGTPAPLLEVHGLRTWFPVRAGLFRRVVGHVRAVDGVDLVAPQGETVALVGESGSGKTTVGRSILRLVEPDEGKILFDGVDLMGLEPEALRARRRDMQIIFQDPAGALDPRMRVHDAIAEGMLSFGLSERGSALEDRVARAMREVRLDPRTMWRYPHEFSGGQRQRIAIARALAVEPRFIVCDESVSALDVSIQAQILNLLKDLQEALGLAYLFITHNLGVVRYLAHRVAVMYLGQIVEEGPTERIFEAPRHPYTRALLAAVPRLGGERGGAPAMVRAGDIPSPAHPPPGCRFHTRCPFAFARCAAEEPPMTRFSDGESRCFLSGEEAGAA